MVSFQQIQNFIKIAEAGSFAKAAEEQYISSTALIQQINLLESNLGFTLLNRTKKGVSLTDAGALFYEEMKRIRDDVHSIVAKAKAVAAEQDNLLLIGYTNWHPSTVASGLGALCIQNNLKHQLNFTMRNSLSIINELMNKELDACIVWESEKVRSSGLKSIVLAEHQLLLGIPSTNPLAKKESISYADLNGQRLVVPPAGKFDMTDMFCKRLDENGIAYELIRESGNIESNIQCIKHNACRINTTVSKVDDAQLIYRPLDTDVLYRICLVYREEDEKMMEDVIELGKQFYRDSLNL